MSAAEHEHDAPRGDEPAPPAGEGEVASPTPGPDPGPRAAAPDEAAAAERPEAGRVGVRGWTPVPAAVGACLLLAAAFVLGRATGPAAPAQAPAAGAPAAAPTLWTCPMHPQIKLPEPVPCPLCGMDLVPLEAGGEQQAPRELTLSAAGAALSELETAPVERRRTTRSVRLVGKVAVDEARVKHIAARFPGRLERLFVDFTGTRVRAHDHLVEIYSPELLSAQEELVQAIRASAGLEGSSSTLLRRTSQQTVAAARDKLRLWGLNDEQIAEIEGGGAPADRVTLFAPIGGVVTDKHKAEGDYVRTGERIYTIADLSQVWVVLEAHESDLPWVRYGQRAAFEAEALPGERFAGRVVFVDPVVTASTRTVRVRLNVDNARGRLKPGMFVRARVEAELDASGQAREIAVAGKWTCPMHGEVFAEQEGSCPLCGMPLVPAGELHRPGEAGGEEPLVVPAAAVLWTGTRSLVYVRLSGDAPRYEGREVVLGPRAESVYLVREGLEEGEAVVVRGAFKLDSALQIEARPSMMLPGEGSPAADQPAAEAPLPIPAAARRRLEPVYEALLALQEALAADDLAAARRAAEALAAAAGGFDPAGLEPEALDAWEALSAELTLGGRATAGADDLGEARRGFAVAARAGLSLERRFGHAAGELREVFCPMAFDNQGAAWLQRGETVANPYFGASMLRCGVVEATHAPRPEGDGAAPPREPEGRGEPSPREAPSAEHDHQGAALPLDRLLGAYLALQVDLAADRALSPARIAAAREAAGALPAVAAALEALGSAAGLEAQRRAFEPVSAAVIAAAQRAGAAATPLKRVHCPMALGGAGADWLQAPGSTANPYFGASMLRCGREVPLAEGGEGPR